MTIISYRYKPNFFSRCGLNRTKICFFQKRNLLNDNCGTTARDAIFYFKFFIFLMIALAVVYAAVIQQSNIFSYKIEWAKKKQAGYEIENQNLKAELSRIKSVKSLNDLAAARGLEVENKPIYVKIDSVKMALQN